MPKNSGFSMKDLLSANSKAQAVAGHTPAPTVAASGFVIQDIPIDKIAVSPSNKYGIRDIEELAASIEEMGLLHNLVVKEPDETGFYELISGERRYHACKLLYDGGNAAYKSIPCKVEGQGSEAALELKLIHANAMSRVLTDYEKTMQAARIKELLQGLKAEGHKFKGRMRDIVAGILDISSAQMGRMESIEKHLSPGLKKEFEAGNIGISAAYDLSTNTPEAQAAALDSLQATGELPAKKEAKKEPSPEKPAPEAAKMERDDPPPAAPAHVTKLDEAAPGRAFASLTDKDGENYTLYGNLAMIVAVDTEKDHFDGVFSTGDGVTGLDYATLAKAVCMECISRIDDEVSLDILRVSLAGLIENSFEGEK